MGTGDKRRQPRAKYTPEEDLYIKAHYAKDGTAAVARHLKRNPDSIRSRAASLGVAKKRGPAKNFVRKPSKPEPALAPIPVCSRLARLAQFDPVLRRVVAEKEEGLPPGSKVNRSTVGYG